MADVSIPREAVEAAAVGFFEARTLQVGRWGDIAERGRVSYREQAMDALNAAAPLLVAAEFDRLAGLLANNEERDSHAKLAGLTQADIESINDAYDVVRQLLQQRASDLREQA